MTDRYSGFVVVLDRNVREDDAEQIVEAIAMVKGVIAVKPHIAEIAEVIAQERVRQELVSRLWDVLNAKKG